MSTSSTLQFMVSLFEWISKLFNLFFITLGALITLGSVWILLISYHSFYENLTLAIQNPKAIDQSLFQTIEGKNKKIIEHIDSDKREMVQTIFSWGKHLWSHTTYLFAMSFVFLFLIGFSEAGSRMVAYFSLDRKTIQSLLETTLGKNYEVLIKPRPRPPQKKTEYRSFRLSGL